METAEQKRLPADVKLQTEGALPGNSLNPDDEYLRQSIIILSEMLGARIG